MMKLTKNGFTLLEVIIAALVSSIVITAAGSFLIKYLDQYRNQNQMVEIQQNIRTSLDIMIREIRMAGYNPQEKNNFGIINISPRNLQYSFDNPDQWNGSIVFTTDYNQNGKIDTGETISYSLSDEETIKDANDADGIPDLSRDESDNPGANRDLVSENIFALDFAFAFDNNGDGALDTYTDNFGVEQIIWAVDTDSDNLLDKNLDTNNDGILDFLDGPPAVAGPGGGNGMADGLDLVDDIGAVITIESDKIRAVRIWILGFGNKGIKNYVNTKTYQVGRKTITPKDDGDPLTDNKYMKLLTATVECRNLSL